MSLSLSLMIDPLLYNFQYIYYATSPCELIFTDPSHATL
jgi:hypothetical protein